MEFFIYDQRLPCRRNDKGQLEFYMEKGWEHRSSLANKWDTLGDPATEKEVNDMIKRQTRKGDPVGSATDPS